MLKTNSNDNYIFDINDYQIIKEIKRGGCGIINLVRNTKNMKFYAAKTNLIESKSLNKKLISREIRILIHIQHPTIIQFQGFSYQDFGNQNNITILMDYMKEGSLADLIDKEVKSLCPTNYDNTKRQIILIGITRAMMILHENHVIHRDLKPENILLDENFNPRITDFGLSKFFDPFHSMNQSMTEWGTATYMAPEVINSDHFNTKADVYAFGIIMFEIITGQRAYNDILFGKSKINLFQLKKKVLEGFRPEFKSDVKKGLRKMIEKCWSDNPKERPTFRELFLKLSLSEDDLILQFDSNSQESNIINNDDDDEDDINDDESIFYGSTKYCLDNVDFGEILDYVDSIKEDPISIKKRKEIEELKEKEIENQELKEQVQKMATQIASLESELEKTKKQAAKVKVLESELSAIKDQISNPAGNSSENNEGLKKILDDQKNEISAIHQKLGRFISAEPNLTSPGILEQLKMKEKSPFDRLFVTSLLQRDIYNLLDPNSTDYFYTSSLGKFYIEFELEKEVMINGLQIFNTHCSFPKSFEIQVDEVTVKTINEANELNGNYKSMTVDFKATLGRKVRFVQKGPNWEENTNFLAFKNFEILSTEEKYSKGVFKTLLEQCESHDPHKCPVLIHAKSFDFNSFYLLSSKNSCCNSTLQNSWLQIELTRGMAVIVGFRLRKDLKHKLKNFKIICTDDKNNPETQWTTLISINEKKEDEHNDLDIYEFPQPSPPTRFIRIVQTGPNWLDKNYFKIRHFDIFGSYF